MEEERQSGRVAKPYAALGRRLRQLMDRERMNQTQLAVAADISISYPTKVLAGEKRPSYPVLRRIAQALRADPDELAHLAGYAEIREGDRPDLPGWRVLPDGDRAQVRAFVARLAELNESASEAGSTGPRRRDRNLAELVEIFESLPRAEREALLLQARDTRESARRRDEQPSAAPTPLHRRAHQEQA